MPEGTGVLVGCDQAQEWLLSWWWSHFFKHNPHTPVAFADFGMSSQARDWCQERGQLIPITGRVIATPETLDPSIVALWHQVQSELDDISEIWAKRQSWFKKPLAMANTPFARTLWLDLDCEVRGDLTSLYAFPLSDAKLSAVNMGTALVLKEEGSQVIPFYSSGVVLFEKDSSLLELWNQGIEKGSFFNHGDDDLLTFIVDHYKITVNALPNCYNWFVQNGPNSDALIYHWANEQGKNAIRLMDALSSPFC